MRSFTAAGRRLGEAPKQLSRRIGHLEEALGLRLFHRTTRRVAPTPEGLAWHVSVRAALDGLAEGTAAIRPGAGVRGRVRVQVPTLFIDAVLDWTSETLSRHPDLNVELLVGDSADALVERGIDLCLTGVAPTGATVRVRRVGTAKPWLCAHVDYLRRHGIPTVPEDLQHHDCLRFIGAESDASWALTHDSGETRTVAIGGRLACNDSRALLRALSRGQGIGPLTAGLERAAAVERVLDGWTLGGIPLYLAVAPGRSQLSRVRIVADALEDLTRRVLLQVA